MSSKKVKKTIATKSEDYKIVFGGEKGKKVLYDIMKNSGALQSSFSPENPHITSFNEGQRSVWIEILRKLKFNPERFEKMMTQGEENYEYGNDQ